MKKWASLFLSFNLIYTTSAFAATLESISRALTTSSSINEFIEKTVPQKTQQNELKDLAKQYPSKKLPKSSLEKGVLTLKESTGEKITLEVVDTAKGEFKINGQKLKVEWQDSYTSLIQKIAAQVSTKTGLWSALLPEAQAQLKGLLYLLIGGIAVANVTGEMLTSDCEQMTTVFRDNLKTQSKIDKREIVATKLSCNAERAEADFVDTGLRSGKLAKIVYSKGTGAQEAFIQISVLDSKPTQNIEYRYFQGQDNSPAKLEGVYINGVAVTDPQDLEFHSKQFRIYRNSMGPLLYSVGKRCYECSPAEIASGLKHGGIWESRSELDKQVMPSTR